MCKTLDDALGRCPLILVELASLWNHAKTWVMLLTETNRAF